MGHRAVLVEDLDVDPASWSLGLRALEHPGVVDVVPAARTVLVTCHDAEAAAAVQRQFGRVVPIDPEQAGAPVEIAVRYDGTDLDDVARATGLTTDDVIGAHHGTTYEVAFCGFAPGFAYLRGLDPRLHLPRRPTPRTSVPAGSVAIAAEYSAVYPRSSPGGWHLLGTTDAVLFDPDRRPPALLTPGARVRFVPA